MDLGAKVAVIGVVLLLIAGAAFVGAMGLNMAQGDESEGQTTTTQSHPTNSETSDGNESDDATSDDGNEPPSENQTDDSSTDNGSTNTTGEDDDTPTDTSGGSGATTTGGSGGGSGTTTGGSGGNSGDDSSDTGSGGGDDSTTGDEDEDEITVASAEIDSGERATLPLVLESAPNGMAGFQSTITVDTSLVTIENATIADDFENLSSVSIADDGSSVTVKALDVNETAEPGATDVQLATLTIEGVESGSTALQLTSDRYEDDDGNPRPVSTTDGEVTVNS